MILFLDKRISLLLEAGLLRTVFVALGNISTLLSTPLKECLSTEEMIMNVHSIMAKVASKGNWLPVSYILGLP